jgi:galactitol-specific phosphotransferase system IIB component
MLKRLLKKNNVEASVSEVPESSDAITTADLSASSSDTVQAVGSIENGVIGVAETPRPVKQVVNSFFSEAKEDSSNLFYKECKLEFSW